MIGEGSERRALEASAGSNISFLGRVSFDELRKRYAECRALVFPGVEDFGIIPLEVMASGRPVIAYAKGGALETVVDGKTGILFHSQSSDALDMAIDRLEVELINLSQRDLRDHVSRFSGEKFRCEIIKYIEGRMIN